MPNTQTTDLLIKKKQKPQKNKERTKSPKTTNKQPQSNHGITSQETRPRLIIPKGGKGTDSKKNKNKTKAPKLQLTNHKETMVSPARKPGHGLYFLRGGSEEQL